MTTLAVEDWPIEQVIPYERNPRRNKAAVEKVAASIREFGMRQPIVVDEQRVIIVGHTRLLAAKLLGMTTVPVHVAKGLPGAKVKAYRIADNRTNDEAGWDLELLGQELADLKTADFDLGLTALNGNEILAALGESRLMDREAAWAGMPEFVQHDAGGISLVMHFADEAALDDFSRLIGQKLTPATRYAWHPAQPNPRGSRQPFVYEPTA